MTRIETRRLGHFQEWLQHRPWPLWRVGNALSTLRFWAWHLSGGWW